ncbi:60S ribosomal protein subunit export [Clavispora lusitaniae]|nr:60S ribosomal protein subunit export [Clavispora lusitaniae]
MAKKTARRGEISTDGDRSLENIPKAENDDVKKSIIRTTIKNENLLAKKMEMDKIRKKGAKRKTSALKSKTDRGSRVEGILATKIQQSIERSKYVQSARKAGWDKINKTIEIKNDLLEEKKAPVPTEDDVAQMEEDEYVDEFFGKEKEKSPEGPKNAFALLEETEA